MPDPRQLPFLLKLLDDDSETVREGVLKELVRFGSSLERMLEDLPEGPDAGRRQGILEQVLHYERTGELTDQKT